MLLYDKPFGPLSYRLNDYSTSVDDSRLQTTFLRIFFVVLNGEAMVPLWRTMQRI